MPTKPLSRTELVKSVEIWNRENLNYTKAAKVLGIARNTLKHRIDLAKEQGIDTENDPGFSTEELPDEIDVEELLVRRKKQFQKKEIAKDARKLINVKVNLDGPIGICHFGDPHIDDDGTDLSLLEKHVNLCRDTNGLFAANVGDLQNNWVGRLSHLYGVQSTSAMESWALAEWLISSVD